MKAHSRPYNLDTTLPVPANNKTLTWRLWTDGPLAQGLSRRSGKLWVQLYRSIRSRSVGAAGRDEIRRPVPNYMAGMKPDTDRSKAFAGSSGAPKCPEICDSPIRGAPAILQYGYRISTTTQSSGPR